MKPNPFPSVAMKNQNVLLDVDILTECLVEQSGSLVENAFGPRARQVQLVETGAKQLDSKMTPSPHQLGIPRRPTSSWHSRPGDIC